MVYAMKFRVYLLISNVCTALCLAVVALAVFPHLRLYADPLLARWHIPEMLSLGGRIAPWMSVAAILALLVVWRCALAVRRGHSVESASRPLIWMRAATPRASGKQTLADSEPPAGRSHSPIT